MSTVQGLKPMKLLYVCTYQLQKIIFPNQFLLLWLYHWSNTDVPFILLIVHLILFSFSCVWTTISKSALVLNQKKILMQQSNTLLIYSFISLDLDPAQSLPIPANPQQINSTQFVIKLGMCVCVHSRLSKWQTKFSLSRENFLIKSKPIYYISKFRCSVI